GVYPAPPAENGGGEVLLAAFTAGSTAEVQVTAGQTTTICFYNEAVGDIVIEKINQTGIESWEFKINDGELPNVIVSGAGTNSVTVQNVPLGTYTVEELFG